MHCCLLNSEAKDFVAVLGCQVFHSKCSAGVIRHFGYGWDDPFAFSIFAFLAIAFAALACRCHGFGSGLQECMQV